MQTTFKRIADSKLFNRFIIGVILAAGVLVGIETSPRLHEQHHGLLKTLDWTILVIFIVEIIIKMGAHGRQPWQYFKSGWNVFDFSIVVICLLPMHGEFAAVLRLARILRVMRLVSGMPRLQMLVEILLKSIPSMAYVGLLLGILFYIYGVMGVFIFGKTDPAHFGTLGHSMLSLFRIVTLEGWTSLMYTQLYGPDFVDGQTKEVAAITTHGLVAIGYFVSFILIGTMIMLNLFIGVIMKSMEEQQVEAEQLARRKHQQQLGHATAADDLRALEHKIDELKHALHGVLARLETSEKTKSHP